VGIIGLPFIDIRALVPFLLSSGTPFGGLFRFEKEVTATLFARGFLLGYKALNFLLLDGVLCIRSTEKKDISLGRICFKANGQRCHG
jgi:hypothetical protein